MAFNICRFKWWPTVQGGVWILRQINHQKDVVITTLSGRTVQKKQNKNNNKKSSVTTCMSLRPFICNWLTGKEAFKCISVIVKTHKSADPLVEVSDFVHLQTLTEDTYRPVIIYRLKITEDLDCVAITIIWPTPPPSLAINLLEIPYSSPFKLCWRRLIPPPFPV